MSITIGEVVLRRPEPKDIEQLYKYRNDKEVTCLLGGFSTGYSVKDLQEWVEFHRTKSNEVLWTIAQLGDDRCIGHVGLYKIDHRDRKAEFAILIGDKTWQGKGLGQQITQAIVDYGFEELNLHRIELEVLGSNPRALHVYEKLGFKPEGTRREAQYRNGRYLDVILMAILEHERK